jgi:general secretion pathway protein D
MTSQRCKFLWAAFCLVATYVVESPGYAQDNQQPRAATSPPHATLITPNYRDADIRLIAEQLARVLDRPIIIDPRVNARVTMLSGASPITPNAFYELFLSALKTHGLVALESSDAIRVVPED